MTSHSRNAVIDLLRGVAITLVMLLHFSLTYRLSQSPLGDLFGRDAVRAVVNNGNYGVTVFFVVSGFLITSNLLHRYGSLGATQLHAFYVMRIARILPPLLLALAIIVPLGLLGLPSFRNTHGATPMSASFFLPAIGSVLSFTHNLLMESIGYFNYCLNIYWSLSVEEMFYLGFPLICIAARRPALIVAAGLAAIVIGPLFRSQHADNELLYMYGYAACFDAIAFGVLAAIAAQARVPPLPIARPLMATGLIALVFVYLKGIDGHEVFGFTGVAGSSALIVYGASARGIPGTDGSGFAARMFGSLRWAGRHSYELYLFHIIVLGIMRDAVARERLGPTQKLLWLLLFIALASIVAAGVARFFSEPVNATLRRRFVAPSRTFSA